MTLSDDAMTSPPSYDVTAAEHELLQPDDDVMADMSDFWRLLGQLQQQDGASSDVTNTSSFMSSLLMTSPNDSSGGGFGGGIMRRPAVSDTFKTVVDGLNLYVLQS